MQKKEEIKNSNKNKSVWCNKRNIIIGKRVYQN